MFTSKTTKHVLKLIGIFILIATISALSLTGANIVLKQFKEISQQLEEVQKVLENNKNADF